MHRSFDTAEKIALCLLYRYGVEAIHDMHNKPLSQRCQIVVAAACQPGLAWVAVASFIPITLHVV